MKKLYTLLFAYCQAQLAFAAAQRQANLAFETTREVVSTAAQENAVTAARAAFFAAGGQMLVRGNRAAFELLNNMLWQECPVSDVLPLALRVVCFNLN